MTAPAHPSEIRLVATDLDGTLLRPDKTISDRTVEAIRRAHEAGLQVVAATGRYPATLAALLMPVGIDYAVASNGAQCYRLSSGDLLFEELLPDVRSGAIQPGRVFDLELPLSDAPAAYAAMDERRAIKVLLRP